MMLRNLILLLAPAGLFAADLTPVHKFFQPPSDLKTVTPAVPRLPWTVAGEHGALLGRQNGKFEAWLWPNKILSNFSIRAQLADYPVPIDVNALAAEIVVTPAETVITYSHAAFTIRQHMFAARGKAPSELGAAVAFEIDSARALDIGFSFTPEMLRMWPAPNFGRPNGEWVTKNGAGVYVLHTDDPSYSAVVAMPGTHPGIMVPYQEHPQTFPLELKLNFDPKADRGRVYPLVFAMLKGQEPVAQAAALISAVPRVYSATASYYGNFFDRRLTIETPDQALNRALRWAEISIDQMQVDYHGEIGMVAGYYESADSARPGYAWFFGRDTLWTTYAINSYGDGALTRRALDFLIKRQREDGKIMHEFSQSADALDWKNTPYFYASADAAPLLVMAMYDYVRTSGDNAYLRENWPAVKKAYAFTRAHESSNGIYNNTEGTGWVESWPQGIPHQEIYLAALDCQSAHAISKLAALQNDSGLTQSAAAKAQEIAGKIPAGYFDAAHRFYAFSRNQDGSLDNTASMFPTVAWWDGTLALPKSDDMFQRWGSREFTTDWGIRDISDRLPFYDPISYHQGSIWPLFTGWASLAEYRAGHPLAGYVHLMQNANLTAAQDLGSITELLSGDYYQPLGRSSSHQMWSSAMVISPLVRGLFGITCDAPAHKLYINPHLPADWNTAALRHLPFDGKLVDLTFQREGDHIDVQATTAEEMNFCLARSSDGNCRPVTARTHSLRVSPLPVELGIAVKIPQQGAVTSQVKVVGEEYGEHQAVISLEAPPATTLSLAVRFSHPQTRVEGASVADGKLEVVFPEGTDWATKRLVFRW